MLLGHGREDQVEGALEFRQGGLVGLGERIVRAVRFRVLQLVGVGGQDRDRAAHGLRQLHGHMAQPAEAENGDVVALLHPPVLHRRPSGHTGAEDGGGLLRIQPLGQGQDEILGHDDHVGIAAEGVVAAINVRAVLRLRRRGHRPVVGGQPAVRPLAIVLVALLAGIACAAAVDHAADADHVAFLEPRGGGADGLHPADDLVTRDAGIDGIVPLVLHLVDVGVADPGVEHLDHHLIVPRIGPVDLHALKFGAGGLCAPGDRFHGNFRGYWSESKSHGRCGGSVLRSLGSASDGNAPDADIRQISEPDGKRRSSIMRTLWEDTICSPSRLAGKVWVGYIVDQRTGPL